MTVFVATDFLLALEKDDDWLQERAENVLEKREIVTSPFAYLEMLIVLERHHFDYVLLFSNLLDVVSVGDEDEQQIVLKAVAYFEDGMTPFDAFHAATAETHRFDVRSATQVLGPGVNRIHQVILPTRGCWAGYSTFTSGSEPLCSQPVTGYVWRIRPRVPTLCPFVTTSTPTEADKWCSCAGKVTPGTCSHVMYLCSLDDTVGDEVRTELTHDLGLVFEPINEVRDQLGKLNRMRNERMEMLRISDVQPPE